MPASVQTFLWRKSPDPRPEADPDYEFQLHAVYGSGAMERLEIEAIERSRFVQIRALDQLAAGTRLAFSYLQPACGRLAEERVTMSIEVTEPLPLPATLGALEAREGTGMIQVASVAGDCDRTILAGYADVELRLSEEAAPFAGVLRYELRIDGERPWRFHDVSYAPSIERRLGASSLGPGRDRLYAPCTEQPRLSAPELDRGWHRVRMVGLLPDDTEIESEEIEVELRCDGMPVAGAPAPRDQEVALRPVPGSCAAHPAAHGGGISVPSVWRLLLMAAGFAGWRRRRLVAAQCRDTTSRARRARRVRLS